MPTYNVVASATSAPTNVGLKVDGQRMSAGRDDSGNWVMTGTAVSSKNPVPYEFRAVDLFDGTTVDIKVTLTAQDGSGSGSNSESPRVPDTLLLIYGGTVLIKP